MRSVCKKRNVRSLLTKIITVVVILHVFVLLGLGNYITIKKT